MSSIPRLNKILAIDLEATCWLGRPPIGMSQDIIEIGCSLVDLVNLTICDKHSIIVQPTTSTVSDFCESLTGLTQKKVENGIPFELACKELNSRYGDKISWFSWDDFDKTLLTKQTKREHISFPLSHNHLDLKFIFSLLTRQWVEFGMQNALHRFDMEFIGRPHRGVDDAYNLARLFVKLMELTHLKQYMKTGKI